MTQEPLTRKVLFITYYWPPAGGAGVQRVLKMAKYLPAYGWEPVVLTVRNGEYPARDESFLNEVPEGIKVYRSDAIEPFRTYKTLTGRKKTSRITNDVFTQENKGFADRLAKWVRLNLFIPDARIGWYPEGIRAARKIIEKEHPQLIFSSSPPHSLQLIAKKTAARTGLPWVADFRDPWSELVHYQRAKRSWLTRKIDRKLEDSVFRSADAVITVGEDVASCIRRHVDRPVEVIHNGYDALDVPVSEKRQDGRFIITYTGELSLDRIPYSLLDALSRLVTRYPQLRLQLVGNTASQMKNLVNEKGLAGVTIYKPYLPHKESIRELSLSDALLLVINNVPDNKGIITGKIFEYMGMQKPILCIGPVDGDASRLLLETDAGRCFSYDDTEGVCEFLVQLIEKRRSFRFDVQHYERSRQAGQLAELFDRLVTSKPPQP